MNTTMNPVDYHEEHRITKELHGIKRIAWKICEKQPMVIPATICSVTLPPAAIACAGIAKNRPTEDILKILTTASPAQIICKLIK